jgi:hypothetical protein
MKCRTLQLLFLPAEAETPAGAFPELCPQLLPEIVEPPEFEPKTNLSYNQFKVKCSNGSIIETLNLATLPKPICLTIKVGQSVAKLISANETICCLFEV